jgi:transposase-like protein
MEMPSTSNVLDEALDLVKKRLAELDEERKRLERALAELGGTVTRRPGRPRGSGRGPGRPPKAASAGGAPRKRRRRSGTRADQAVALVEKNPGISASEIAKQMKIKPNYLYRVLGELEKEGRVKKKGRAYHPAK